MRRKSATALAALAVLSVSGAGEARQAVFTENPDWDLAHDERRKIAVAYVRYASGLTVGVRCMEGRLDAVMSGLPEAPRGSRLRPLRIALRDEPMKDSRWNVTRDRTAAVADYPAPFARELREGGRFQVVVPNGGGPGLNLRHDLVLPASSTAIDSVLTACEKPLVDPRDALLPDIDENGMSPGIIWTRGPRPTFPSSSRYREGYAVTTCMVRPNGSLGDCVVESEHPNDGLFARAALAAIPSARVAVQGYEAGAYPPRMVGFRTAFSLIEY
jgi:hypothetical protein